MDADIQKLATWADPLIRALTPGETVKLSRRVGQHLRRSQARRIAQQRNPDGTPYEARKKQPDRVRRRMQQQRGRIRRTMFAKLRTQRFLRLKPDAQGVALGFIGRVGRIARVHQKGLRDRVEPHGPSYDYPVRELLGFSKDDELMIREQVLEYLQVKRYG